MSKNGSSAWLDMYRIVDIVLMLCCFLLLCMDFLSWECIFCCCFYGIFIAITSLVSKHLAKGLQLKMNQLANTGTFTEILIVCCPYKLINKKVLGIWFYNSYNFYKSCVAWYICYLNIYMTWIVSIISCNPFTYWYSKCWFSNENVLCSKTYDCWI